MSSRLWSFLSVAVLVSSFAAAETIQLDRCIAGKCRKFGTYRVVQITEQHFIVYIDADRCPGLGYHCPTSYGGFSTKDGTPLDSGDYVPGTPTNGTIKIYVPREYKGLYVHGLNGGKLDDYLALDDFEDQRDARETVSAPEPAETSVDELFEELRRAYGRADAALAASLYVEHATVLAAEGPVRGRDAVRQVYERLFERGPLVLTLRRGSPTIEGRLGYEVGTFHLEGESWTADGPYFAVVRYVPGAGWRIELSAIAGPG